MNKVTKNKGGKMKLKVGTKLKDKLMSVLDDDNDIYTIHHVYSRKGTRYYSLSNEYGSLSNVNEFHLMDKFVVIS